MTRLQELQAAPARARQILSLANTHPGQPAFHHERHPAEQAESRQVRGWHALTLAHPLCVLTTAPNWPTAHSAACAGLAQSCVACHLQQT